MWASTHSASAISKAAAAAWEGLRPGERVTPGLKVFYYGVTTGQAVAPLVVQTMRPWIAGLIGVLIVM